VTVRRGARTPRPDFDPFIRGWFLGIAIVVSALTLVACSVDEPPQVLTESGVEGTVTYGPLCPVAQAASPCPDRPWQGKVRALGLDGVTVVGTTSTDKAGAFSMNIPPGGYFITPITPDGPPTAKLRRLTVTEGAYTSVELTVDSGIR
jgi:hypothetical protein